MNKYIQFVDRNNPDGIWRHKRHDFGDWLAVDMTSLTSPTTPFELIGTAYWAHSVDLMIQMGRAASRTKELEALLALNMKLRKAFMANFVRDDGYIGNGSQTSYVLALKFGLVPEGIRAQAARRLAHDIERRGKALSTGFLGTQYLLDVLIDNGFQGLAFDLLLRTEYPSWGHMIRNGATTIIESWNGRVWCNPGKPTESIPCSNNHFALGAVCGFLFRRLAGIDFSTQRPTMFVIRPVFDSRIRRGGGEFDSVVGRVKARWSFREAWNYTLEVSLPANSTGRIHLSTPRNARITESGVDITNHADLHVSSRSIRETVVDIGSGMYQFEVRVL